MKNVIYQLLASLLIIVSIVAVAFSPEGLNIVVENQPAWVATVALGAGNVCVALGLLSFMIAVLLVVRWVLFDDTIENDAIVMKDEYGIDKAIKQTYLKAHKVSMLILLCSVLIFSGWFVTLFFFVSAFFVFSSQSFLIRDELVKMKASEKASNG